MRTWSTIPDTVYLGIGAGFQTALCLKREFHSPSCSLAPDMQALSYRRALPIEVSAIVRASGFVNVALCGVLSIEGEHNALSSQKGASAEVLEARQRDA